MLKNPAEMNRHRLTWPTVFVASVTGYQTSIANNERGVAWGVG